MGFTCLELKMPTDYTPEELEAAIQKKLHIKNHKFSYTIDRQSLDARKKNMTAIHWNIKVGVTSPAIKKSKHTPPVEKNLEIPTKKREKKIVVTGSGPAGFFAGYVLLLAGFDVTIIEQGPEVEQRFKDIVTFERSGELDDQSNYAFGEGGAGTFSDGKLTSRTKSISLERKFIFDTYVQAGAPPEISWLSYPHIGSDNLRKIVRNLRFLFREKGGRILFNTKVTGIDVSNEKIAAVETKKGKMDGDIFLFAPGHSSYGTYRVLIRAGAGFRSKPFALGCRVEHRQETINLAQWGCPVLPGLKAAEYRLTYKPANKEESPVYSFCMCPGGKVVPSAPYRGTNIVNGMSNYRRNSPFANAAIVAAVNLDRYFNKVTDPLEALEWLQEKEEAFFKYSKGYAAPACTIEDFLSGRQTPASSLQSAGSSYPLGLTPCDFYQLLPDKVVNSLRSGMKYFCSKLKNFDQGIALGLESKTSSPIQALRDRNGRSETIENLYIIGEGSGFAGGITSSAADGIKAALSIASL